MESTATQLQTLRLPYVDIPQLAFKDRAYAGGLPELRPFYRFEPKPEAFADAIQRRQQFPVNREVLTKVLKEQYAAWDFAAPIRAQIEKLGSEKTFTVTTAHQPSLFTGPLYFIYKAVSAIRLAEDLQRIYPAYQFVPVFVLGSEDHDFEEINHLHLYGKSLTWESGEHGATGAMKTAGLAPVLEELAGILGNSPEAAAVVAQLKDAYLGETRYDRATQRFLAQLFADHGLVVFNMNDERLKRLFIPVMQEELLRQSSKPLVEATCAELEKVGFSQQAFPREINLFYMDDQLRERIEKQGDHYVVVNTDLTFTEAEMMDLLLRHPGKFSPNVVLRPLYQETILPNLAYIGGGGELAYWLERQRQFEYFGVYYPVLVRRNSVLWIDNGTQKRLQKLGLQPEQLFHDTEELIKTFIKESTDNELSLKEEYTQIEQAFQAIADKAREVDPTLEKAVAAEAVKQLKIVEQLEGRLMRAEKQRHDTAVNQIRSLREKLFPGNGLQERHDNFLPFYIKYGPAWLDQLKEQLDPLTRHFLVIGER